MEFSLYDNYPNPFNSETTIQFTLPNSSYVNIDIYSLDGRLVIQLINDNYSPGAHTVIWNGTDQLSREIASGVYIYKLQTDKQIVSKKMILLK
jgi:flagellar hook assembly protein FlgD